MMDYYLNVLKEDISLPFEPSRFKHSRLPIRIGNVLMKSMMGLPSCLDMLIKLPSSKIMLPEPYSLNDSLLHFINQATDYEDSILPEWRTTRNLFLTLDYRFVEPGKTHRNAGWHFDGMQGERYVDKLPVCHQYISSSILPTEFSDMPFDATILDERKHNWYKVIGNAITDDKTLFKAMPDDILLMSAYQMHRSPIASESDFGWRVFVRLDFTLKQFDRLGNSINPILPAPWKFVRRDPPKGLLFQFNSASWKNARKF